jgi:hypothetical protein
VLDDDMPSFVTEAGICPVDTARWDVARVDVVRHRAGGRLEVWRFRRLLVCSCSRQGRGFSLPRSRA